MSAHRLRPEPAAFCPGQQIFERGYFSATLMRGKGAIPKVVKRLMGAPFL